MRIGGAGCKEELTQFTLDDIENKEVADISYVMVVKTHILDFFF